MDVHNIDLNKKITIKEYAEKNHKDYGYLLRKCRAGRFQTAIKIGTQWFIDADEPYQDLRIKNGGYVNIRETYITSGDNNYGPKKSCLHDIYTYKLSHPNATITEIAQALKISAATVSKWWPKVIEMFNSANSIDNSLK